jgi:peptidoglycan-associated lipoprotein
MLHSRHRTAAPRNKGAARVAFVPGSPEVCMPAFAHTLCLPRAVLAALCCGLLGLVGCASTPVTDTEVGPRVVTRTSSATVWATPEAALAVAAPAAAPRQGAEHRAAAPAPASRTGVAAGAPPAPAAPPATGVGQTPAAPAALAGAASASPAPTIYFDFDRFIIRDEDRSVLEGHAQALAADRQLRAVVEGHADERGGAEYNLALGQRRAQAVVTALVLLGVAQGQLEAVSFGDTRPVVSDSTESAWARNRRAEVKRR